MQKTDQSTYTKDQKAALKAFHSGQNVCLTGQGGTGKTFILNEYISEQKEAGKNIVMMASTGIAALKIDGVTMHSACGIPVPAYGKYKFNIRKQYSKIRPLEGADIIVIDEISMCRNDVFEYFCMVLEVIDEERKKQGITKKTQVIVSGDFFQLPPVVKKDELAAFKRLGLDPSGYCFTTPAWKAMKFKTVILNDVVRQSDDEFIRNLNLLRRGDASCIDYFNSHVITEEDKEKTRDAVYICSTNAVADEVNSERLDEIDGPCSVYKAEKKGFTGKDYTVDEYLMLKQGAKVMFMANDMAGNKYRNGQTGVVKALLKDKIIITDEDGKDIWVDRYKWSTNQISVTNGMTSKKEVGSYTQFPLKPAYAITMHKTQGQTYPSAVISPGSFADGQLYVACSRVQCPDGLFFTEEIKPEYIKVSPLVRAFYDGEYVVPETRVKKKKELESKAEKKNKEKTKKKSSAKTAKKKPAVKRKSADKPAAKKPAITKTAGTKKKSAVKTGSTAKKSAEKTKKITKKTISKAVSKKKPAVKTTAVKKAGTAKKSAAMQTSKVKKASAAKTVKTTTATRKITKTAPIKKCSK